MVNKDAIVKTCVSPAMKAKAMVILNTKGLTISEYLRLVLEQLVENHEIHGGMIIIKLPERNNT